MLEQINAKTQALYSQIQFLMCRTLLLLLILNVIMYQFQLLPASYFADVWTACQNLNN
jgi:hypothetical protein